MHETMVLINLRTTQLDMTIEPTLKVMGVKLSKLTQALATKAISAKKRKLKWNQRERTKKNLEHKRLLQKDFQVMTNFWEHLEELP